MHVHVRGDFWADAWPVFGWIQSAQMVQSHRRASLNPGRRRPCPGRSAAMLGGRWMAGDLDPDDFEPRPNSENHVTWMWNAIDNPGSAMSQ